MLKMVKNGLFKNINDLMRIKQPSLSSWKNYFYYLEIHLATEGDDINF